MDVCYLLGKGSVWFDLEIKYSVRSLLKHGSNIGNIFIIGEKPAFFEYGKGLYHIPFEEKSHSQANMWNKTLELCKCNDVASSFLWMNDDHFFLSDFDAESYPYYHMGKIRQKRYLDSGERNPYFKIVSRTVGILENKGLPGLHFDTHTPMIIQKDKFIEVYNEFSEHIETIRGIILKSSYCNYWRIEGVEMDDLKLKSRYDLGNLERMLKHRHIFSTGLNVGNSALLEFMEAKYPFEFSTFEKIV